MTPRRRRPRHTGGIHQPQAGFGGDLADAGERHTEATGERRQRVFMRRWHGEAQLVIVA
jgi:hypothetical protein